MQNTTTYTQELLLNANMAYLAKWRTKTKIYAWITSAASLVLFAAELLVEDCYSLPGAILFFCLALCAWISLSKNGRSQQSERAKKQMENNPNTVNAYRFEEDYIVIDQTSDNVQSNTQLKYTYVAEVIKIDERSLYFLTKNNFLYVLYDDGGVDGYFSYICEKTGQKD